jgi:hypothetical protein
MQTTHYDDRLTEDKKKPPSGKTNPRDFFYTCMLIVFINLPLEFIFTRLAVRIKLLAHPS